MATSLGRRAYLAIGLFLTNPIVSAGHRWIYRRAAGRGVLSRALGMDMLLVTARGRRSGEPRTVPLGALRLGDAWIVVGSNSGKARTPDWVHNLRADGTIEVESRGRRRQYLAHEAGPEEAVELWPVVIAGYPGYGVYRERTSRPIALFVLEPRD